LLLRFREALLRAALNSTIADALTNYDTLELAPDTGVHFPNLGGAIKDVLANPGLLKVAGGVRTGIMTGPPISGSLTRRATDAASGDAAPADTPATVPVTTAPVTQPGVSSNAVQRRIASGLWSDQFVRLTNVLGGGIVRGNSPSLFVPSDVKLMDAEVHSSSGQSLTPVFYRRDGTEQPALQGTPIALSDIARIAIRGSNASADVDASVALTLIRNSVVFPLELPAVTIPRGTAETRVVQINAGGGDVNLKQHLMDNRLYYSQAVFRTLDAAQIAGLLSGFSMNLNGQVVSVAQVVDPIPLRVVGNYLAFKISSDPTADAEWKSFLDRRGIAIGQAHVEFVPLSSGGVFAEAVLGRFNSAEKLDITRFWNWQDSPIPIQPSDIAPITAASRTQPEAIAPGQLSAPIVSIQQPTALPDPSASFAATIAAIQNGNMFRDMSGLSEVVKLAQSAIQASSAGATAAGAQASSNYQTAVKEAADIFKAKLLGSGDKKSAADENHSAQGALINEQDKRKGGTASGGTTGGGGAKSGSNGSNGSTSGTTGGGTKSLPSTGGGTVASVPSSSSGNPALDVATFGPEGKPTDEAIRNALGLDPQSPVPTPDVTRDGVPLQSIANVGIYGLAMREKEGADETTIDEDTERQLIASNLWQPDLIDLGQIVAPERSWSSFGSLLFSLSVMPAGSVRTLSLVGYAPEKTAFSFNYSQIFDKKRGEWIPVNGDVSGEPHFLSIRMKDLLHATAVTALPPLPGGDFPKVELADVRNAFAANAQLRIYNIGLVTATFIQVIANFFQVQTVAFPKGVRVLAEEIGVSDTNPPALLKSYRFGFSIVGDPSPARTVQRLEHLLNEPLAYLAYPRRV
jgi:hypothetical protein